MDPVTYDVVPGEVLLAHPVALLAIPALVPAIVVILVVLWVARRDRIAEERERAESDPDGPPPRRRSRLEIG